MKQGSSTRPTRARTAPPGTTPGAAAFLPAPPRAVAVYTRLMQHQALDACDLPHLWHLVKSYQAFRENPPTPETLAAVRAAVAHARISG